MHSPLPLILLALLATIHAALAQSLKIAFPKPPASYDGYATHLPENLSRGTRVIASRRTFGLPEAFRSHARRRKGFVYTHPVPPGTYQVTLGWAEFTKKLCRPATRVFSASVNGVPFGELDVFSEVGCRAPFTKTDTVVIGPAGLVVSLTPVTGTPFLANIEVRAVGDPPSPSPAEPSPTPAVPSPTPVLPSPTPAVPTPTPAVPSPTPAAPSPTPAVPSPTPAEPSPTPAVPSPTPAAPSQSPAVPSPAVSAPASPPPATSPSPAAQPTLVKLVDVGGKGDNDMYIVGPTKVFPNIFDIEGTTKDARFSKHRFGMDFSYVIPVQPEITYSVNLFFAESFKGGCKDGFRIFDVAVYDETAGIASAKTAKGIEVFKEVGCRTAYSLTLSNIAVGTPGSIVLNFKSVVENAMVSAFEIVTDDPAYTGVIPTPGPTEPSTDMKVIDVGGVPDEATKGTKKASTTATVSGTLNVAGAKYKTNRFGSDFMYSFNLAPGSYKIILGFAEIFAPLCSEPGKRVMNVYVNDLLQLEGFDVFAEAGGCNKGYEVMIDSSVGAVDPEPLTIRFQSVVNFAQVSYISVKPGKCVPASMSGETGDFGHAAHAVPGTYPPQNNANSPRTYVDTAENGFVTVRIDGSGSHTHFFDAASNIIGRLTAYKWSIVETGKVISTQISFNYKFPLGTTRLKLSVIDNACTTDEAETTITVTGAIQPGQYCYYYDGLTELPIGGELLTGPKPQVGAVSTSAELGFPSFSFADTLFAARCFFFLQTETEAMSAVSVNTFGSGVARLYKGDDLIFDSEEATAPDTILPVGLTGFEVVYIRTSASQAAKMSFLVDGVVPKPAMISHDRRTILPIISALSPPDGPVAGGTKVKVTGYGLFLPLTVSFGGTSVNALSADATQKQFFVNSPVAATAGAAKVFVTSSFGMVSNEVTFSYDGANTCPAVGFNVNDLTTPSGADVDFLKLPTCATIGQDGKIYMGTLGSTVQVLGYDAATMKTSSYCYSKGLVDNNFQKNGVPAARDALGITFDPRDNVMKPYISTSTFYWYDKNRIDFSNKAAWRNGAVDRLKPGTDPTDANVCLVYDKRIVSGLPVSNHDHAINGLLFTQDGDLLIAVGGFTNMGLPGYKLGGYWETTLSAAVLIAKLSKAGFDGDIQYSDDMTPRLAKKISGDVDLYATGLRNTFALTMTTAGNIYAADQGPNCGFGDTSTTCSEYDETLAAAWDPAAENDWTGLVPHGWVACPYSLGRPDKIVQLMEGSWYGHPNIQRGGKECAWIDPFDDLTAGNTPAPAGYKKAMVTVKSSVTGIEEYRASHFCGKLKGELILSTYKGGKTYRMEVNGGSVLNGPDELSPTGGITFVENEYGDLIFPRLTAKKVTVLQPKGAVPSGLFVAGLVPFRFGKAGGGTLRIGGSGFGASVSVKVGGKTCAVQSKSGTAITCTVPAGSGLADIEVVSDGETASLEKAVLYMDV